ncbi:MAG: peptide chain release factor 3 [Acidimicrobiia bacterium]
MDPGWRISREAERRRTFAIISHPDAGKTTLTEKFLLYGGAVAEAGAVRARRGARATTSDWMELERTRGISISSTVLQFEYAGHVVNLLDTPGHRDFSEDTYRTLAAVDAAIIVLDTAKGIEPQTLKLFEVSRQRQIPVLTFLNKYDRPGREPLELLDETERVIGLRPTPVTWPVGIPGDFRGIIDRRDGTYIRMQRSAHGATAAAEEVIGSEDAANIEGLTWDHAREECALLDAVGANLDVPSFLRGETTPLFVGSALTNFGVRQLLDAVVQLAPAPSPRLDVDGRPRDLESPFSGVVFKIQANMNPSHRDRVAFLRVCSGHFERGVTLTQTRTGRPFGTKFATSHFGSERGAIDDAWPGDVIGLVNASDLHVGDTLYAEDEVEFPAIPPFAPEIFARVSAVDTTRSKRFRRGLDELADEGVVQLLYRTDIVDARPLVGAVGALQLEVLTHRMATEYGANIHVAPTQHTIARRTDAETAESLRSISGVDVYQRRDGALLALFSSQAWLDRLLHDKPQLVLEPVIAA